jgi:CubicO group peptidase (beta-lactamase class C family)
MRIDGELDRARFPRTLDELERGIAARLHLGGQLYVSRSGESLADAGFGEARPGAGMTRRHRMLWLSATKPVAAVAIAMLWERDVLGLDDPVARHLPEFGAGGKQDITIRHLLTHTAGIRMLDTGWPERSWDEIVARICARPIEPGWVPGRRAGYHLASSWFVLGELVRRLDGRPFERFVREEIFAPLGLTECSIGVPAEELAGLRDLIAPMYASREGELAPAGLTADLQLTAPSPGANGCGPLAELGALYETLLGGGSRRGARILRPQTVEAMVARHRVGLVDQTFKTRLDWGLGVIVNSAHYGEAKVPYGYGPHAGPRAYGHSGARSSAAFADPDAALVVALAVNGLPEDETHRARFERLTAAIYEDLGLASRPV